MNIDFLSPMMLDSSKLVFMNFSQGKVYEIKSRKIEDSDEMEFILVEIDKNVSKNCFDDFENKKEDSTPEIPFDKINQVLNTERDLSQQNEKHIFRRNP